MFFTVNSKYYNHIAPVIKVTIWLFYSLFLEVNYASYSVLQCDVLLMVEEPVKKYGDTR
jgi:hypothetical protein